MRAVVWTQYGPPEGLEVRQVPKPTPRSDEVLIRIRATTVSSGDCEMRRLGFSFGLRVLFRLLFGLARPKDRILGQEMAGEVEAVGARVTRFRPGDVVFGTTGFRFGTYAEYVCLRARARDGAVATKPNNMTFDEAAAVSIGGLEALHFLRSAGELRGRRVLVLGAGGGIGVFAVQLGKHFGAHVTAVDRTEKLATLLALGADRVVDFTRPGAVWTGEPYDVIFDIPGVNDVAGARAAVAPGGCYLMGNVTLRARLRGSWAFRRSGKRVISGAARSSVEDLDRLRALIEAGHLRSVLDHRCSLEEIPAAHRLVESGRATGKVVVLV